MLYQSVKVRRFAPSHIVNIGISNEHIGGSDFDANISYRWQSEFYWTSSFGSGFIDAYGTIDASIMYNIDKLNTIIKIGGTNLIGPDYRPNIGGPFIGKTVFLGITYDLALE